MQRGDCTNKDFFISGPMSGLYLNNVPEFARVHAELRTLGAFKVFDPAYQWLGENGPNQTHEWYMHMCLERLLGYDWDYVVMLDGWEDSQGASLERQVALACGIEVIEESDLPWT